MDSSLSKESKVVDRVNGICENIAFILFIKVKHARELKCLAVMDYLMNRGILCS